MANIEKPFPEAKVQFSISYNDQKYKVKDKELNKLGKKKKDKAKKRTSVFRINRLLAYFNVTDLAGTLETDFSDSLEFKITYSPDAWVEAVENNKDYEEDRPRVAYLISKPNDDGDDDWVGDWVEFPDGADSTLVATPPNPTTGSDGFLVITVHKLKDPLIGGC